MNRASYCSKDLRRQRLVEMSFQSSVRFTAAFLPIFWGVGRDAMQWRSGERVIYAGVTVSL